MATLLVVVVAVVMVVVDVVDVVAVVVAVCNLFGDPACHVINVGTCCLNLHSQP